MRISRMSEKGSCIAGKSTVELRELNDVAFLARLMHLTHLLVV